MGHVARREAVVEFEERQNQKIMVLEAQDRAFYYIWAPRFYHTKFNWSISRACPLLSAWLTVLVMVYQLVFWWVVQGLWVFEMLAALTTGSQTCLICLHGFMLTKLFTRTIWHRMLTSGSCHLCWRVLNFFLFLYKSIWILAMSYLTFVGHSLKIVVNMLNELWRFAGCKKNSGCVETSIKQIMKVQGDYKV